MNNTTSHCVRELTNKAGILLRQGGKQEGWLVERVGLTSADPFRSSPMNRQVITVRWMILPYLVAAAILAAQFPALAQSVGDAVSGREIATKRCSSCHRVLPMTLADKADPPSFQSIADLPSTTGISLNAFLHSNHQNMPDFIISSADSHDLIAYILSLKKH